MKGQIVSWVAVSAALIAVVMAVGSVTIGYSMGTKGPTLSGTIISQKDSGNGAIIFGNCVSIPNCGLTTTVRLSNGTTIEYVDTCYWPTGATMNFTHWSKAGWQQDTVMCD